MTDARTVKYSFSTTEKTAAFQVLSWRAPAVFLFSNEHNWSDDGGVATGPVGMCVCVACALWFQFGLCVRWVIFTGAVEVRVCGNFARTRARARTRASVLRERCVYFSVVDEQTHTDKNCIFDALVGACSAVIEALSCYAAVKKQFLCFGQAQHWRVHSPSLCTCFFFAYALCCGLWWRVRRRDSGSVCVRVAVIRACAELLARFTLPSACASESRSMSLLHHKDALCTTLVSAGHQRLAHSHKAIFFLRIVYDFRRISYTRDDS